MGRLVDLLILLFRLNMESLASWLILAVAYLAENMNWVWNKLG